jgi:hypothetical protein
MIRQLQNIFIVIVSVFFCLIHPSCKSHKAGHNEYFESKTRVSEREMKKNKKIIAKQNRTYKKQLRHNRKYLFGRSTPKN